MEGMEDSKRDLRCVVCMYQLPTINGILMYCKHVLVENERNFLGPKDVSSYIPDKNEKALILSVMTFINPLKQPIGKLSFTTF